MLCSRIPDATSFLVMSTTNRPTAHAPWKNLPEIPGEWTLQRLAIGDPPLELILPARPDDFLDDPEVLEANRRDDYMPYWSYLWPAATAMAAALRFSDWSAGTEILELGCGVGLVGLAGLQRGWQVTFSDHDPTAVACAMANATHNHLGDLAAPLVLDWRSPLDREWPVIIGCDLLYEVRNHDILLHLLDSMLAPRGVCWIGDPGRAHALRFAAAAIEHGYHVRRLDAGGRETPEESWQTFHILELTRP